VTQKLPASEHLENYPAFYKISATIPCKITSVKIAMKCFIIQFKEDNSQNMKYYKTFSIFQTKINGSLFFI